VGWGCVVDRKSRPLVFAVGVAVVSAAALAVVEWPHIRAWYRPPRAGLPAPDEVARTEAAVWASGSQGNVETDIPWFVVPEPIGPRLLRRFTPNTYLPRPGVKPDAPLGELVVTAADGRVTHIRFYETGPDDLVFTTDGKHFFQAEPRDDQGHPLGGALLLAGTLRHASVTPAVTTGAPAGTGDLPLTDPAAFGPPLSPLAAAPTPQ
jgi:hypothetical protein